MENSNLENDIEVRLQNIENFVGYVSPYVWMNQITDGNYSPSNGLSGLDQVIEFYVGSYLDDDFFNRNFVKAKIVEEMAYLKYEEDFINSQSIEDIENCFVERDTFYSEEYWEDEEEDEFYWDDEHCYEDEEWEEDEWENTDIELDYYTLDEPEFTRMVKSIASGYMKGTYTSDNPCPINGKTGLEQVLFFASQLLYSESRTEDLIYEDLIEKQFKADLLDLRGGTNLSTLTPKNFKSSMI